MTAAVCVVPLPHAAIRTAAARAVRSHEVMAESERVGGGDRDTGGGSAGPLSPSLSTGPSFLGSTSARRPLERGLVCIPMAAPHLVVVISLWPCQVAPSTDQGDRSFTATRAGTIRRHACARLVQYCSSAHVDAAKGPQPSTAIHQRMWLALPARQSQAVLRRSPFHAVRRRPTGTRAPMRVVPEHAWSVGPSPARHPRAVDIDADLRGGWLPVRHPRWRFAS